MWGLINGCQPSDDRPASETARSNDMMSNTTSDVMNEETPDLGVTDHGSPDRGVFDQEMTDLAVTDMSMSHIRDYELDDVLRLHHVQSLGTHNSYHLASEIDILPWRYSHLPLDEQLGQQGVRQFELDIYDRDGVLEVFHIDRIDPNTTCETLRACLGVMSDWSRRHPQHQPIVVLLEVKEVGRGDAELVEALEAALRDTWGVDRVFTPRLVQRQHPTLRAGLEAEGWPTLGATRGRILAVLHAGGALRSALVGSSGDLGDLGDRLLFPDAYGDLEAPFAAYHSINDPISSFDLIERVVRAGHVVRTRSDVDGEPTLTLDYTQSEAALESGAHWISTDYPRAPTPDAYGFLIPEGEPSRCNPLTAPAACRPGEIE